MNVSDYNAEWTYRIQERLGITCGTRKPTESELAQVKREVAADMDRLEQQEISARQRVLDRAAPLGVDNKSRNSCTPKQAMPSGKFTGQRQGANTTTCGGIAHAQERL